MNVNRSGYYKWVQRKGKENQYALDRRVLTELLKEEHDKHKSYGYHRLAAVIRRSTGWVFSDNLAHKCCKFANIKSKARHYKYKKTGQEHILYKNIVNGIWNATEPLKLVVSDMTCLRYKGKQYEWTYILDTFNNEIISSSLTDKTGSPKPYYNCLEGLLTKIKEQTDPLVLHTDQGSVYSSSAYQMAHKHYNIIRSMSRVGTPTDNPIIESLNGWIKAEIYSDYDFKNISNIYKFVDDFVYYFNNERPAYALNYKTPVQYKIEQGFI